MRCSAAGGRGDAMSSASRAQRMTSLHVECGGGVGTHCALVGRTAGRWSCDGALHCGSTSVVWAEHERGARGPRQLHQSHECACARACVRAYACGQSPNGRPPTGRRSTPMPLPRMAPSPVALPAAAWSPNPEPKPRAQTPSPVALPAAAWSPNPEPRCTASSCMEPKPPYPPSLCHAVTTRPLTSSAAAATEMAPRGSCNTQHAAGPVGSATPPPRRQPAGAALFNPPTTTRLPTTQLPA